jgi:hypothetical protein
MFSFFMTSATLLRMCTYFLPCALKKNLFVSFLCSYTISIFIILITLHYYYSLLKDRKLHDVRGYVFPTTVFIDPIIVVGKQQMLGKYL